MHDRVFRRPRRRASRGRPRDGLAAFLVIVVGFLLLTQVDLGAILGRPPASFRAIYVLAADESVDPDMMSAIRTEIDVVQEWVRDETDGRSLRFAEADGRIAVDILRLERTMKEIQAAPDAFSYVTEEIHALLGDGDAAIPLAFVKVIRWGSGLCGEASETHAAIVWGGGCVGGPLASSRVMGDGATPVIAHEMLHALGAVASCAPNATGDGHVNDRRDILDGNGWLWVNPYDVQLDPGRDDYYEHGTSCGDIADHPAWMDST